MQIKLAPWEKRNLGVEACEFYVAYKDTAEEVFREIDSHNEEYQVLHIDAGNTEVLLAAQRRGFQMIELNMRFERDSRKMEFPRMYQRFIPKLSYYLAEEEDNKRIIDELSSGKMFLNDKVSRDPFFGPEKSGHRYACWMRDIIDQGVITYMLKYKDQLIGFSSYTDEGEGEYDGIIAGIFPEYEGMGLGFVPALTGVMAFQEKGFKKLYAGASSNNTSIIKVHEMLGFITSGMNYVLVKHC